MAPLAADACEELMIDDRDAGALMGWQDQED